MYLKRIIQDILPINQLSLSGCIRWLPPELVDNGDLPEISILQMSILGLLLQLSNRPNEYTLSYLVFFKLKKKAFV